jgi:O-antigen/teichoic acid export membrane protein
MTSGTLFVRVARRLPPATLYYLSYGITPFLGLVQTKVLTNLLSPDDFGRLQLVLPLMSWSVIVGGLGGPTFLVRYFNRDGVRTFHESLWLLLVMDGVLALACLGALLRGRVAGLAIGPAMAVGFLLAVGAQQVFQLTRSLLRATERHVVFNTTVVLERLLGVSGVVVAILLARSYPVEAFLIGGGLGTTAAIVAVGTRDRKARVWRIRAPDAARLRSILVYGLPVVAVLLVSDLFASANRYVIISGGLDASAVARFVVGYTIASLGFMALSEPLITYLHPQVFKAYEAGEVAAVRHLVGQCMRWYVLAGLTMLVALGLTEPWLVRLVSDREYLLEPGVFPLLLGTNFFLGLYRFLATHYYLRHSTVELAACYGLGFAASVTLAALLVRSYGLRGVAAGVLGGAILLCMIVWWRGRRVLPISIFG